MGVVIHHYVSPYSFVMGVLWFNAFVLLGLAMRKARFPIKFSVIPLLLLLVLSILRMFIFIEIPGAVFVPSETLYPAIANFARIEILSPINISHLFIFVWVAVAIWLTARYLHDYIVKYRPIMNWLGSSTRDEYAEALFAKAVGYNKHLRIFRNNALSTAVATPYRPYIILPNVELSDDRLLTILKHEWKHIRDRDYLTGIIVNLICFAFWWNPVVYILRRNFHFAKELKCDQFAVSNDEDFIHFIEGLLVLDKEQKRKREKFVKPDMLNGLTGSVSILEERLEVLALKGESRSKRILATACYSIVVVALFVASYSFIILPAHWESPYVSTTVEDFMGGAWKPGDILRAEESYIVDNGDGTFSLYIDGHFVMYMDDTNEMFNWFSVRVREEK